MRVEVNRYFPPESLRREFFSPSNTRTVCPRQGQASYYTVSVDGKTNRDAAWYYHQEAPSAGTEAAPSRTCCSARRARWPWELFAAGRSSSRGPP